MSDAVGPGYTWAQTKSDLTMHVAFPAGTKARSIACTVERGTVAIGLAGEWFVDGELWDEVDGSVWSMEGASLTLELEKKQARFWPCAIRGHPEVDVAALKARERKEAEPPYKVPDSTMEPQRVTDRETLAKLKAEFPQMAIDLGPQEHTATHKPYSGPRKQYSWGALPPAEPDVAAPTPVVPASAPVAATSMQPGRTGADAPPPAAGGLFDWGALPPAEPGAARAGAASAPVHTPPAVDGPFSWGALPPAEPGPAALAASAARADDGPFSWGALPS